MTYFDDKQKKLIKSWHKISLNSDDFYMKFMSEWIAFNAICYNLYYEQATIERANIDRKKSKSAINALNILQNKSTIIPVVETIFNIDSEKWSVDLKLPQRLFIKVTTNYTEDIIFKEFVDEHQNWYNENQTSTNQLFEYLKKSLQKKNKNNTRFFVINMAKSKLYKEPYDIDKMAERNIVVLCEKNELRIIKNILYQIRCNIFHGEKTPGDPNDDRIVKNALPLLRYIVERLMHVYEIDEKKYS